MDQRNSRERVQLRQRESSAEAVQVRGPIQARDEAARRHPEPHQQRPKRLPHRERVQVEQHGRKQHHRGGSQWQEKETETMIEQGFLQRKKKMKEDVAMCNDICRRSRTPS